MAQQYGAAQPLYDWTEKYVAGPIRGFENLMGKIPSPSAKKKVDTSWHDEMLKETNEAFAKEAAKDRSQAKKVSATGRKAGVQGKMARKKVTKKIVGKR